ncbi:acyl-CoA ligase (AMP-forming), exosortase A system-associated [Pseudoalteromonas aliena]|jgi:acyl-CoA ligase (AMP-forming) (exosortase A-associated)|uniref:Acyl-CoA ligase (AMP-forming), exosortase A system-associated n=1 Tax=Pseudoalteromonas aliena SW19 TaxID=1314866 RepID=A0ABR9DZX6_9GAMM|nr:acyl-CoA ligase (AMP-forming), exosortase A system-associated [Pseudoalteromonas aliena]MBE0359850.1 hypothetical protein [Pseudoalteromonas aliena SW19]
MLLHELLTQQAKKNHNKNVLGHKKDWLSYQQLTELVIQYSHIFNFLKISKGQRIAIYLPKTFEAVISIFATSACGGVFVPVNPILKARQVEHILQDCSASILITNQARLNLLDLKDHNDLRHIILIDSITDNFDGKKVWNWQELKLIKTSQNAFPDIIDSDISAIFYTSGSTGKAKGVVLNHRNLVMGAKSVSAYLPCLSSDVMLAVQPLSFDYGFSQLTLAFLNGASCYMEDYIFEQDLLNTIVDQKITCLALVPPLWARLANCHWPEELRSQIRYFCNTGGVMPKPILTSLRQHMPNAQPYLMYGLTEAFRSCYLPPEQIEKKANSFGKAIPNAQISVINDVGHECSPFEHGELVHRGVLVSQGYWNDDFKTAERFRPAPNTLPQVPLPEIAVWSGDIVYKDQDGYFYFVSRKDDMIKTSGYRVSPQEVEEVLYQFLNVQEAIVIGIPHDDLGQVLLAVINSKQTLDEKSILKHCKVDLPNYMLPKKIIFTDSLPRNNNGKFDRLFWQKKYQNLFIKSN